MSDCAMLPDDDQSEVSGGDDAAVSEDQVAAFKEAVLGLGETDSYGTQQINLAQWRDWTPFFSHYSHRGWKNL